MKIERTQRVGRHEAAVIPIGFGGTPFGNWRDPIPEQEAADKLAAAHAAGIRYFDTAPFYAMSLARVATGRTLRLYPERVGHLDQGRLHARPQRSGCTAG